MNDALSDAFDDGAAFIPYIAAGDPGAGETTYSSSEAGDITIQYTEALIRGGADIVELGLPFSEPIADGPTVRRATTRALDCGMTPDRFFEVTTKVSGKVPIVVMTYYNLIYQYGDSPGVSAFVKTAAESGVSGIIVPDLPVEESMELHDACAEQEIALIYIVAPTTRDDRLNMITELGTGYLYVQARLGTTGAQAEVSDTTAASLARIRSFEADSATESIPKAVGFGISSGDHARTIIASGANGIIVGSALIDLLDGDSVEGSVDRLESKAQELKAGALAGLDGRNIGPERT